MITETAENTVWSPETGQRFHHGRLSGRIPGDEVTRQHYQVGLQAVRNLHVARHFLAGHEWTDVYIGKLRNSKALKRLWAVGQADASLRGFKVEPAVKHAVGPSHERRGTRRRCGLLQESPPRGRRQGGRIWRRQGRQLSVCP